MPEMWLLHLYSLAKALLHAFQLYLLDDLVLLYLGAASRPKTDHSACPDDGHLPTIYPPRAVATYSNSLSQ